MYHCVQNKYKVLPQELPRDVSLCKRNNTPWHVKRSSNKEFKAQIHEQN